MTESSPKRILVVGGGTAGWITALYAKKILPDAQITLVESKDVGILGAGEGTTPHFVSFTDLVDIPISRLIQETNSTIKAAIKFTNWNGDGDHYYHGFATRYDLGFRSCNPSDYEYSGNAGLAANAALGDSLSDFDLVDKLGEAGKVPFIRNELSPDHVPNSIFCFNNFSGFAMHFDARQIAEVFAKVAQERGITRIEGKVARVEKNQNDEIMGVVLEDGSTIGADFFFDCTGFARLLIGKSYKSPWKSYAEYLPADSAIPFFLPAEEGEIPPYTESIAMKYGWMWKIPLQHRYGCGYVFDSSLTTEEEAKAEIEEFLGHEIESPKTFKFEAGYYETPWVKNCIAVGLSSGFFEPLEATSIWSTIATLRRAFANVTSLFDRDQEVIDTFNSTISDFTENIGDFIYFHYITKRDDTSFWKRFSRENAPQKVQKILSLWDKTIPEYHLFSQDAFLLESWMAVASGLKLDNKKVLGESYESYWQKDTLKGHYLNIKNQQDSATSKAVGHRYFLEFLK